MPRSPGAPGSCAVASLRPSDDRRGVRRGARSGLRALALLAPWLALCARVRSGGQRARGAAHQESDPRVRQGAALYERFGHGALRVYEGSTDLVYSFGAAPFSDPGFLWRFARGEGEFRAVAEPYQKVLALYRAADRTLLRQELLLPHVQRSELAHALWAATRPGYDRYVYDQLYDNCATRLRNLIDRASRGALTRAASQRSPAHSYRDDTLAAMAGHPVGHWALDLIGGRHQDLPVTSFHEMYLPAALRARVAEAVTVLAGKERPLADAAEVVLQRRGPPLASGGRFAARAIMVSLASLLAALTLLGARAQRSGARRAAALSGLALLLSSSLFGCLVWPLAVLSRVHNFSPNENVVLFWPSDLVLALPFAFALLKQRPPGLLFACTSGSSS